MIKENVLRPLARANAIVAASVIAVSALVPALLLNGQASGAQLGDRFIDMSANQTSEGSGREGDVTAGQDVTYRVSLELTTAHSDLEGIVVQFCGDSPIVGDACSAIPGFATNFGSGLAFANGGGTHDMTGWTLGGGASYVILSNATGHTASSGDTIVFDLGTAAAADGITNPSDQGSFYARISTYTDNTVAAAYTTPTSPGAFLDEGGIALSVANELTVTARVQEVLEFCIGTEEDSEGAGFADTGADDCTDVAGTDLDLGVVDASTVQTTNDTDIGASGSDGNNGLAMVRTNALNGAVVYYKAEQEAGLANGGAGTLRQAGVDNCGTIASVANACFNSAGGEVANPTQTVGFPAGTELFGMSLREQSEASGGATTDALVCDANYDGDGTCTAGAATGYAWSPTGAFDTIASSTGPIDDETVRIIFAATASPTTPTGLYTVTANFVTTSTF